MKISEEEMLDVRSGEVAPDEAKPPRRNRLRVVLTAMLALAAVAAVVVAGILPRVKARQAVAAETEELAVPSVTVIHLEAKAQQQEIVLPANIQPFIDAPVFARTSGYLKSWVSDIGTPVKKGQLLAEIESPEVDAQLRQARADLATAQVNLNLSQITAKRDQELIKTDAVSRQDLDNAVSDLAAKQSTVQSAQENVHRLEDLVSFEKIYAPFDGIITARNTDIGQLINSGSGAPTTELFHLAAIDTLRVFVNVPQIDSPAARLGLTVDLTVPQFAGRRFAGTLVRTADSIDSASRTLLVEIDVNNRTHELLPGAYAEAHFKLPPSARAFLLPVPALIFRAQGLQVATVDDGKHAVLKPVKLGRDFGTQVEVLTGLNADDVVVVNPPDSLVDGEEVHPVPLATSER